MMSCCLIISCRLWRYWPYNEMEKINSYVYAIASDKKNASQSGGQ